MAGSFRPLAPMLQGDGASFRQAQDEGKREWHLSMALRKFLILSLSKDAPCRSNDKFSALPRPQMRKALALARELLQERRRAPEVAVRAVEALHIREHPIEPDRVGVEHRPAAPSREAVAGDVDDVDVGGAQRDALLEQLGALVDQRVDGALDDLVVGDRLARHAEPLRLRQDQLFDLGVRQRRAAALVVAVPAGIGLLPVAAPLADLVGEMRVADRKST